MTLITLLLSYCCCCCCWIPLISQFDWLRAKIFISAHLVLKWEYSNLRHFILSLSKVNSKRSFYTMISIRNFEKRFEWMFLQMLMNYAHRIRHALVWITDRISGDEFESIKMLYTKITGGIHSQESVNCVEIHFGRYYFWNQQMEFYVQIKKRTRKQYEQPTTLGMMNFSTEEC